jgi:hypothetical protein
MRRYGETSRIVTAPCCGRRVAEDMLVDAAGVPEEHRPRSADYCCDACRVRLFHRGIVTPLDYYTAAGADEATLRQMKLVP